jgi:tetratricopeptide (TPR) repeat protein
LIAVRYLRATNCDPWGYDAHYAQRSGNTVRSTSLRLLCLAVFVSPALAQDDWVGGKFMPKDGCTIKVGNREIAAKGVPLPYVVGQVSGDWLWIGDGWVQKNRVVPLKGAGDYYADYLRTHPNSAWAHNLRGWVSYESGDYAAAVKEYTGAIQFDRRDSLAYNNRGGAWQKKGEYDNAIKDYNETIRLSPQESWGYNSLAWLLATCPQAGKRDGSRAVTLAKKACALANWKDAYSLDTLAAACAEAGDFDEAVRWQSKAIGLVAGDMEFAETAQERLALYRDKTPYHESASQ